MDEEAARHMFQQIDTLWIQPEVNRRREAGTLPSNFQIYRCLIKMPQDQPPIVEFNDEIGWSATASRGDGRLFTAGEEIYLHDIGGFCPTHPKGIVRHQRLTLLANLSPFGYYSVKFFTL